MGNGGFASRKVRGLLQVVVALLVNTCAAVDMTREVVFARVGIGGRRFGQWGIEPMEANLEEVFSNCRWAEPLQRSCQTQRPARALANQWDTTSTPLSNATRPLAQRDRLAAGWSATVSVISIDTRSCSLL
jgi:hypothetical protein